MSDQGFSAFVTDHAALVAGVVQLVTDDVAATREVLDSTWPEVFRRWPDLSRSRHLPAVALAPFVAAGVRRAELAEGDVSAAAVLELRDDVAVGAPAVLGRPGGGQRSDDELAAEDLAVRQAFADLRPRERALVALGVYVGVADRDLPWAVRWRPIRAADAMHRAHRDLMLTAAPQIVGAGRHTATSGALEARVERVLVDLAQRAVVSGQATFDALRPRLADVRQRRPRPRPRPAVIVGVGATLAAVAVGVSVAADDRGSRPDASTSGAAPAPVAQPGMRLVGYGPVYTSVPSSWTHNQIECGRPAANTVVYPDASGGCDHSLLKYVDVPPSSLTFNDPPTNALVVGRLRQVSQVGDFGVYATTPVRRDGLFQRLVVIPEAGVQMALRTSDIRVMDDIVDSLQAVPDDYTVVPPCQGLSLRDAFGLLDEAGLAVKLTQSSVLSDRHPVPPVTRQTIASGEVVPTGTVVGLGFPSMD